MDTQQETSSNNSPPPAMSSLQTWLKRVFRFGKLAAPKREQGLPTELAPNAALMEACRVLRVNLAHGQIEAGVPPLLFVGSGFDPGCLLTAAGLALALAEEERLTLLVDADLRHPLLHKLFQVELSPGLAEALAEGAAPPAPTRLNDSCWLLPAGTPKENVAELLRRPALGVAMQNLAARFDTVIYALSSGLAFPDALLLAPHTAAAVLAIRSGVDSAPQALQLKQALERTGVPIAGFVMLDRQRP